MQSHGLSFMAHGFILFIHYPLAAPRASQSCFFQPNSTHRIASLLDHACAMKPLPPRPFESKVTPPWVGARSALVSAATNAALAFTQISSGLILASPALLADGIHSFSDLGADLVVIFAARHAQKAPDHDHAYGHKRFETGACLILGLLLISVGLGLSASAGAKLGHPELIVPASGAALFFAAFALAAKELLFRHMMGQARKTGSALMLANAWHARSDAASSLVVLLGLSASLYGYPLLDPVAALIVGLLVAKTGWSFSWDALHDLMDRTADLGEIERIRATLLGTPGVLGAHDVKARKMGDFLLVDAHIEVDGTLTVAEGHRIAVNARARVLASHRALNLMTHVDPHLDDDDDHDGHDGHHTHPAQTER
jgi:cation diffusion facilitator family transporter